MITFKEVLLKENPEMIIFVGDVNWMIACSLDAKKLHFKVAHVQVGLRSFDRYMPAEINRILTDSILDYLFVIEKSGMINLKKEGVFEKKIFFVGNCMVDNLISILTIAYSSNILENFLLRKRNLL